LQAKFAEIRAQNYTPRNNSVSAFQQRMAADFFELGSSKEGKAAKATILAAFAAKNPGRDLNLSIDGQNGATTRFFAEIYNSGKDLKTYAKEYGASYKKNAVIPAAAAEVSYEDGLALAKVINKAGVKTKEGQDFSCQACVALEIKNPKKIEQIGAAVAKRGTPEQMSQLLSIVKGDAAATEAAKSGYADEATKEVGFFGRLFGKTKVSGLVAAAGGVQSNGNNGVIPLGQIAIITDLGNTKFGDAELNLAASSRARRDGGNTVFPLSANITVTNGKIKQTVGLFANIGNANYRVNPFSSTTDVVCGCMTDVADGGIPAGDGPFEQRLHETAIAGYKAEYKTDKTVTSAGIGVSVASDVMEKGRPTLALSHEHKLNDKTIAQANAVFQQNGVSVNAGVSRDVTDKLKLKMVVTFCILCHSSLS
jgi:hypothetical protein